jgi:hypothetical protein
MLLSMGTGARSVRVPMITILTHAPRMIPSEHLSRHRAGMNGIFDLLGSHPEREDGKSALE